jgi:sugar phosphate permease
MLAISCIAVVGGFLLGLMAARILRRRGEFTIFSLTGAASGALGLILYLIGSTASNQILAFSWQGLSWVLIFVLFAITGLYILSGNQL